MHNEGNYIISLGNLCRWLAQQAENLGVEIYPGFAAQEALIDENGIVRGIVTGDLGVDREGNPKEGMYTPGMELRAKYKDLFEKTHNGVRLGFMSFFVKAAVEALKRQPGVNASIDGNDIVYHGYQDIGVAVSSDRGLVVPVLRNAEHMSLAEIEGGINEFGKKAKAGKLTIEEMTGGTFTISNGGVFGSLLSTPIVNPPQTAILGMHKIQERPMAVNGQVVILPMMYLALSYDHRLIDGKEAVTFLVTMKDLLEDPARLLLDI